MTSLSEFLRDAVHFRTVPLVHRFIADSLTPLQIFESLQSEAVYLLESKDNESPWSRYSFIGLSPFMSIENADGSGFRIINEHGEIIRSENSLKDAFLFVQTLLNAREVQSEIPFNGGAVGYLSYDFISSLEKIPTNRINDLHLAQAYFVICESIVVFDHLERELVIIHYVRLPHCAPIDEKIKRYHEAEKKVQRIIKAAVRQASPQILQAIDDTFQLEKILHRVEPNYLKGDFLYDVQKIKRYIAAGDIFQAVLSQRFAVPIRVSGFQLYRSLCKGNPSPYMFYIQTKQCEIIGSSPEKLVEVHQKKVEIHPIAGTRRRGRNRKEDEKFANELLTDPKEHAEHYMLVDLARNDIGKIAKYGTVQTMRLMELRKFSYVMHLISKVVGELREDVHPIEALLAAFPAGTVSGAPKIRAMEIIGELEPVARNIYAGAVAYIGFDGNIDSCIAIRTAIVHGGNAYVQAGAGIVADSVPKLEWKETINKASSVLQAIQLAEMTFGRGVYV